MLYLFAFSILFFLSLIADFTNTRIRKEKVLFGIFLFLIFMAACRYRVGMDTIRYMEVYDLMPSMYEIVNYNFLLSPYEPFWVLLCAFSKLFGADFFYLQLFHAWLLNIIIWIFFKKHSSVPITCVMLYFAFAFFEFNFEVLREALAIGCSLLAIEPFFKRKWKRYYIICLLAFGFHFSALVLFIFPLFHQITCSRKQLIYLMGLFLLFYILINSSSAFISLFFFKESIINKAEYYFSSEIYGKQSFNIIGLSFVFIKNILLPFLFILLYKFYYRRDTPFYPFLYIYLLLSLLSIPFPFILRFRNYLWIPYLIFLADFLCVFAKSVSPIYLKKAAKTILLLVLLFFQYYPLFDNVSETTIKKYCRYYPYETVFTSQKDTEREMAFQLNF